MSVCQKVRQDESGLVMVTVLVVSVVMMVLSVGILSVNINQFLMAQRQIDRVKALEFAKGQFWANYSSSPAPGTPIGPASPTLTDVVNGKTRNKTFNSTINSVGLTGPGGTYTYNVVVSY